MKRCALLIAVLCLVKSLNSYATLPEFTGTIDSDMTINVPSDGTINEVFYWLENKTILPNVVVTVRVADGSYNNHNTVLINHPQGRQIRLLGNTNNPSACALNFVQDASGFVIEKYGLMLLDGFRINGVRTTGESNGILVREKSIVGCGTNIQVYGFKYGLRADDYSSVIAKNALVSGCVFGFFAVGYSHIVASGSIVQNYSDTGYTASDYSRITAINSVASGGFRGFLSSRSSTIIAWGASAQNNSEVGFYSLFNSMITLSDTSSSTGNGGGIYVAGASFVNAPIAATISGNGDDFSPDRGVVGNGNSFISQ